MRVELKQQFQIESARRLPNLPANHPCSRLHGHSFVIVLTLQGEIDPKVGWLVDYHHISKLMQPLLETLDHRVLNEVPGLENPTSELICVWLFEKAKAVIPQLVQVTVNETSLTSCSYPIRS